jgi:rod shape-determining protein MreC
VIAVQDNRWNRLLLSVLLTAAVGLITIDYRDSSAAPVRDLRHAGSSVFSTAEGITSVVTAPLAGLFGTLSGGQPSQVAALQAQLTRMRSQLSRAQVSRQQSAQLNRLLQVAGRGGYRVVAATVVAVSQGYQSSVTLDAGRADGVRPQQTVLNGAGLVGTVTSASAHTCTVLLATDTDSVVGIRLARGGQIGWVTGTGKNYAGAGLLRLQVLGSGVVLRPGEQLVTAASVHDRPYVPGVPVGFISQLLGRDGGLTARALVRPYADLTALDVAGIVIAPPRRDPRFSVLPAAPHPARSPSATPPPSLAPSAPAAPPAPPPATPSPAGPAALSPSPTTTSRAGA